MKIAYYNAQKEEKEYVQEKIGKEHKITFIEASLDEKNTNTIGDAEVVCIFVGSLISKEVIDKMPKVKLILTRSMGYNHIETAYAKKKGITVACVPKYGARTVAEFAFSLILALSRKTHSAYDELRTEGSVNVKEFEGFNLEGKTIGIIGTGNIGRNAIKIAKGFAMNVLAFDVYPDEKFAKESDFKYVKLDELLKKSDIVSIHVPLLPTTEHLIDKEKFKIMKDGAILINTARGGIIDTLAMVNALEDGKLSAAGLDVLEGERHLDDDLDMLDDEFDDVEDYKTLIADHKLIDMKNVIVTPHIAFNTKEAKQEIIDTTLENLKAFIKGKPINEVNY